MNKTRILSLLTLSSLLGANAFAAITYTGFDAAVGTLDNVTDGTGWRPDGWENQSTDVTYSVSSGSPLVFGDLLTSGNYMNGGGAYQSTGRSLSTGFQSPWDLAGAVSAPFSDQNIDTGTVWASMLVRVNSSITSWDNVTVQFIASNIPWDAQKATEGLSIRSNGGNAWGIATGTDGSYTSSGISPTVGQTAMLVTKFELNPAGQNNAYLWVVNDPASITLGGADLSTASAHATIVGATTEQLRFRSIRFYLDNANNRVSVDEIRLGQTFASVTPVPEPSTYAAIAALGVLALAWLRRRR